MTVQWREQLSLGNELIDMEHRYLICLVNMVTHSLSHPEDSLEDLKYAIDELVSYTRKHFEHEEKLQLKIQYAGYAEHKMHHQKLMEKIGEIHQQVKSWEEPSEIEGKGDEIAELLRSWLLDHVVKEDMKLKPLLKGYSRYLAPD
ncbi:MAG: hemerythrin family protein [Sedimenticola sp.]